MDENILEKVRKIIADNQNRASISIRTLEIETGLDEKELSPSIYELVGEGKFFHNFKIRDEQGYVASLERIAKIQIPVTTSATSNIATRDPYSSIFKFFGGVCIVAFILYFISSIVSLTFSLRAYSELAASVRQEVDTTQAAVVLEFIYSLVAHIAVLIGGAAAFFFAADKIDKADNK